MSSYQVRSMLASDLRRRDWTGAFKYREAIIGSSKKAGSMGTRSSKTISRSKSCIEFYRLA